VDDCLVSSLAELQVADGAGAARLLDLPDLFIQYLLSLASEGFTPLLGLCVEFEDGLENVRPTATTWSLAPVLFASSTAFMAASCACGDPSVASNIRVGKALRPLTSDVHFSPL
jgi:hypothetical protein